MNEESARSMKRFRWAILLLLCWVAPAASKELVIGALVDLTGLTRTVGKPYADGIGAYAGWINANGGINGKPVRLVQVDYAYRIADAVEAYKRFRDVDGVLAIQGWGTPDTEALTGQAARDEIPYFSASYSAHLTDPSKAPYNFFVAADYSTQLRAGLKYLRDNWSASRKPKIAFLYPDHPYGRAPIRAGKEFAEELGFEIVGEEHVKLDAIEATTQLLNLKKNEPDFAWLGGTTPSCAVVIKDARVLGMKTRFLVNIWGNDESLVERAGDAAEGVLGLQAAAVYGDAGLGMRTILEVTQQEPQMTHYVRGWVSMMVLCEALKRADRAGELTGPGIRKAAETLVDFDTQGLTAPITYLATDHRPNMSAKIYESRGGAMVLQATTVLERKAEWLGY